MSGEERGSHCNELVEEQEYTLQKDKKEEEMNSNECRNPEKFFWVTELGMLERTTEDRERRKSIGRKTSLLNNRC